MNELMKMPKKELEEISLRIKSNTKKCLKIIVNDTAMVNDKQCRILTFTFSNIVKKPAQMKNKVTQVSQAAESSSSYP